MKNLLKNFVVTLALMALAVVAICLFKYIGAVIVFLIFLACIPVVIDVFFGLLTAVGLAVASVFLLGYGWLSGDTKR